MKIKMEQRRLGDIATILSGGDAPKGHMSETKTDEFSVPIYSNGITDKGLYGYTNKASVVEPATTISARGTIGVVFRRKEPYLPIVRLISIIGNRDFIDPDFLYYKLCNTKIVGDGSVQAQLTIPMISDYVISIPCIQEQKRIAAVLNALDTKIELNIQINHNLEEQAKAIFKHYFSKYNKVIPLGKICKCVLGGTPNREKADFWNGNIPWINSGKVNEFRIIEPSEYITKKGLEHSATKMLPRHTTVLAITGATLGQVSLLEIDTCANQSVVGIVQNESLPYTFIYPFVKENIKTLMAHQTGGAQQHINKQNVEGLLIPAVDSVCLLEYDKNVSPIFEHIGANCFESLRLAQFRDSLLPKLMSGEIDVSEVKV